MASKRPAMDVQRVKISDLHLDDRNPRKGDVASIAASLKEFGQHRPVVVQKDSRKIIAGNHMIMAAQSLGWTEVDAVYVDDDDAKAIRRAIADNATSSNARWDDDVLAELMREVGTDVPGITDAQLSKLFKDVGITAEEPIYPLLAKPGEDYDYVVFFTESVVDTTFLLTLFGQTWKDWKMPTNKPGRSRILPVAVLREMLAEHGVVAGAVTSE